jgi:hypothetical protein
VLVRKLVEVPDDPDPGLLEQVVGLAAISGQPLAQGVKRDLIAVDQDIDQICLPALTSPYDLPVLEQPPPPPLLIATPEP